jgi:hypothetical protein
MIFSQQSSFCSRYAPYFISVKPFSAATKADASISQGRRPVPL